MNLTTCRLFHHLIQSRSTVRSLCFPYQLLYSHVPGSPKVLSYVSDSKQNKIKAPLTGFFRFSQEQRQNVLNQNPGATVVQQAKELGAMWKELPQERKEIYKEAAAKEYKVYKQSLSVLSEEEKLNILKEKREKRKKRATVRQKKIKTGLGMPKRPLNSFFLFLNDQLPFHARNVKENREQMKDLGEKWKSMSEEDKRPFKERGEELMANYKEVLLTWEKEMLEAGRQDLVRVKSRPKKVKEQKKAAKVKAKPIKSKAKGKKVVKKNAKGRKTTKKATKEKKSTKEGVKSSGKVKKSLQKEDKDPSWMREE